MFGCHQSQKMETIQLHHNVRLYLFWSSNRTMSDARIVMSHHCHASLWGRNKHQYLMRFRHPNEAGLNKMAEWDRWLTEPQDLIRLRLQLRLIMIFLIPHNFNILFSYFLLTFFCSSLETGLIKGAQTFSMKNTLSMLINFSKKLGNFAAVNERQTLSPIT